MPRRRGGGAGGTRRARARARRRRRAPVRAGELAHALADALEVVRRMRRDRRLAQFAPEIVVPAAERRPAASRAALHDVCSLTKAGSHSSRAQPGPGRGEPRRDRALGHADHLRRGAVVVAVLVHEDDEDALLHRQPVERVLELRPAGDDVAGIVVTGGVRQGVLAGQQLEAALPAQVVEARGVGDAVEPRAHVAVAAEAVQRLVRLDGRVLERVVHEHGVAEHAEREGAQAAVVVLEHPHERLTVAAPGGARRSARRSLVLPGRRSRARILAPRRRLWAC